MNQQHDGVLLEQTLRQPLPCGLPLGRSPIWNGPTGLTTRPTNGTVAAGL